MRGGVGKELNRKEVVAFVDSVMQSRWRKFEMESFMSMSSVLSRLVRSYGSRIANTTWIEAADVAVVSCQGKRADPAA